jgi:class 3 adenylate cyclase
VLFADVVHSMDIAAAVGAERLREIMTKLVERSAAVVRRYGGTVDKFTGDSVVAQTHSLVLITYRPEYRGALSRTPGAQMITLAPLNDSESARLI